MKPLHTAIIFSALLSLGGFMAGCSHGVPSQTRPPGPVRPTDPDNPGGGQGGGQGGGERPGAGESYSFDSELKDDEWRYSGRGVELRYGRGGVLVSADGDNLRFSDLDGATSVEVTAGRPSTDSICGKAVLRVNGRPSGVIRIKFMHRSDKSVWYDLLDTDSIHHVIVAPA